MKSIKIISRLIIAFAGVSPTLVLANPGDVIQKLDNPQPGLLDSFGFEVAASKKDLVVGSPRDSNNRPGGGSVYFYDMKTLGLRDHLDGIGNDLFTSFGAALAISGKNLVIGEPEADFNAVPESGYAYLVALKTISYLNTFANPSLTAQDYFGKDVAASKKLFAVGAPGDDTVTSNAGTVYIYDKSSSSPTRILFPPSQSQNQEFGSALAFLGNAIAVGAPGQIAPSGTDSGMVHLYDAKTRFYLGMLFESPTRRPGTRFGAALAASKKLLAVGAPGDTTSGSVFLYDLGKGVGPFRIDNPTPTAGDEFGASLAYVGKNYILVGAPGDDTGGVDAGAAYLFDVKTQQLVLTIINPESSPGDRFGQSVATDGSRLIIGCPGNLVGAFLGAGSVFVIEGP